VADVGSQHYISSSPRSPTTSGDVTTRCGSALNPWVVHANIGQQLRVTMLDFGRRLPPKRRGTDDDVIVDQSAGADKTDRGMDTCSVYGYILDKAAAINSRKNITKCDNSIGRQTDGLVYLSKGSTVEVFLSTTDTQTTFLLGFEGYLFFIFQ